jgi:DNA-binding transcriptional regulator YdaS (Cro superfamily)
MTKKNSKTGIQKAADFAGGIRPLGTLTGISKSFIFDMVKRGRVPAERCQTIHEKTGVPLHELNPLVYRKPERVGA